MKGAKLAPEVYTFLDRKAAYFLNGLPLRAPVDPFADGRAEVFVATLDWKLASARRDGVQTVFPDLETGKRYVVCFYRQCDGHHIGLLSLTPERWDSFIKERKCVVVQPHEVADVPEAAVTMMGPGSA